MADAERVKNAQEAVLCDDGVCMRVATEVARALNLAVRALVECIVLLAGWLARRIDGVAWDVGPECHWNSIPSHPIHPHAQGNNMTLGRKLVRLGLTHEDSVDDFRKAALQVAPVPPALLEEQHHTIRQRYRQAYAAADEAANGGGEAEAGTVGLAFVAAAGNGDGGGNKKVRHQRKDDDLKPVFIKPQPKEPGAAPVERKSMLGLDKLAALKRAEKMMKEKLELGDENGEGGVEGEAAFVKKEEEEEEGAEGKEGGGIKKSYKVSGLILCAVLAALPSPVLCGSNQS